MNDNVSIIRRYTPLFFILMCVVICGPLGAKSKSKEFVQCERRAKKYGFAVSFDDTIPEEKILPKWKSVLDIMDRLPCSFVTSCNLRMLVFEDSLVTIDGHRYGGFASGRRIVFCYQDEIYAQGLVHELYHLFDHRGYDDREWAELNPKDFVYTQHRTTFTINFTEKEKRRYDKRMRNGKSTVDDQVERKLGRKISEQIKKNENDAQIQKGFVSKGAQKTSREDRADTFAYMMTERRDFLCRTNDNPVLERKMKFIIKETSGALGKKFWDAELKLPPRAPESFLEKK